MFSLFSASLSLCLIDWSTSAQTFPTSQIMTSEEFIQKLESHHVIAPPNDIQVGLYVRFEHLYDMDGRNRKMISRIRIEKNWNDERIAASINFTALGNPKRIYIPRAMIWTPVVLLRNLVDSPTILWQEDAFFDRRDGRMHMRDHVIVATACNMTFTAYPFDRHKCDFNFNGVGDYSELRNKSLLYVKKAIFVRNSEWNIMNTSISLDKFENAVVLIECVRHITYPMFYLLAPGSIITLVCFLQFLLPPDGGERTGIGITCMLSHTVFMMVLQENFAPDESNIPRLAVCFGFYMLDVALATMMSSIIIHIFHRGNLPGIGRPSPRLCRLTHTAARLFCFSTYVNALEQYCTVVETTAPPMKRVQSPLTSLLKKPSQPSREQRRNEKSNIADCLDAGSDENNGVRPSNVGRTRPLPERVVARLTYTQLNGLGEKASATHVGQREFPSPITEQSDDTPMIAPIDTETLVGFHRRDMESEDQIRAMLWRVVALTLNDISGLIFVLLYPVITILIIVDFSHPEEIYSGT